MDVVTPAIHIDLAGRRRRLAFDLNTYAAYEEVSGKPFFETFAKLYGALKEAIPKSEEGEEKKEITLLPEDVLKILSKVAIKDLRAMLWAAMMEGEAVRLVESKGIKHSKAELIARQEYQLEMVGGMINHSNMMTVINSILSGHSANQPTEEEIEEVGKSEESSENPTPVVVEPGLEESGQ